MKTTEELDELLKQAIENPNNSIGKKAKRELELEKMVVEMKRNHYLYWITVFLAIISVTNVLIQIIRLIYDKK